jgi:hypothetical protein
LAVNNANPVALSVHSLIAGKGGKNRRRGKNDNDDKRELIFKEDGQGKN